MPYLLPRIDELKAYVVVVQVWLPDSLGRRIVRWRVAEEGASGREKASVVRLCYVGEVL